MTNNHPGQDAVPDAAASISNTTVSNLTDNSNSRSSRTTGSNFTNRSDDSSSLRRDREREGRCADCGAQTHEIRYDPETGLDRKIPLNIEGEVHRGRCLLCNPLPVRLAMPQHMFEEDLESIDEASSAHQYHGHDRIAHWRAAAAQSGQFSSSRSLEMERPYRGVRSDGSVVSYQTYNSAPLMGRTSYHANPRPIGVQSSAQPPLEEFTIRSRGGQSNANPPQPMQHRRFDQSSNAMGSGSVGSNLDNLAIDESRRQHHTTYPPSGDRQTQASNIEAQIREILSSMQRYPNHVVTQSKGLHSLWVLSWEAESVAIIGRLGGIPLILDSMRLHSNAMALVSNGISTLQNLALDEESRGVILDAGGVTAIVEVMADFLQDKTIQLSGCTTFANLAMGSSEQKVLVAESGSITAMMRAVNGHRGDESICRAAYQALRRLGYNPGA